MSKGCLRNTDRRTCNSGAAGRDSPQYRFEAGRLGRLSWACTGERETKQRGNTAADERAWCRNGNRSSDLTRLPRLKYTGVILSLILDFPFKGVYNPPFWICFCP